MSLIRCTGVGDPRKFTNASRVRSMTIPARKNGLDSYSSVLLSLILLLRNIKSLLRDRGVCRINYFVTLRLIPVFIV